MWPQRSYPDTPMGLRVHRSRMAGVSNPCNPKTLPARPPPAFRAKRPSGLRKGLSPNKEVCHWPLEGAPSRSPPFLPLVTALPQLYPLAGHLGGPQGHHPLRHWGSCGLEVCCLVGGGGVGFGPRTQAAPGLSHSPGPILMEDPLPFRGLPALQVLGTPNIKECHLLSRWDTSSKPPFPTLACPCLGSRGREGTGGRGGALHL